jgi:hypothetical protein
VALGHGLSGFEAQTGEGEVREARGFVEGSVFGDRGEPGGALKQAHTLSGSG